MPWILSQTNIDCDAPCVEHISESKGSQCNLFSQHVHNQFYKIIQLFVSLSQHNSFSSKSQRYYIVNIQLEKRSSSCTVCVYTLTNYTQTSNVCKRTFGTQLINTFALFRPIEYANSMPPSKQCLQHTNNERNH